MHIYVGDALKKFGCNVKFNENMAEHTTFKTGGTADIFCGCNTQSNAENAYFFLYTNNIPFTVIGRGSNILVSDKGYRGVILKFYGDNNIEDLQNDKLKVSAGINAKTVILYAVNKGLAGGEFAATIPGSIGGLIYMNAGCFGKEMKDIIESVEGVIEGEKFIYNNSQCKFSYRESIFTKKRCIIISATLKFAKGCTKTSLNNIKMFYEKRKQTQPYEPSAGSTFKRQGKDGDIIPAKLIEEAGLKGFNIGDAEISLKHSGFIVNKGKATSKDIYKLIQATKDTIYKKFAVNLTEEIIYIGEF